MSTCATPLSTPVSKSSLGFQGTQTLPLDKILAHRDDLKYVMARHETAIPHMAWGCYESGGGVAATLTVPGPGDANASHGMKNALDDGVPIIYISADADHQRSGDTRSMKSIPRPSTTW